VPSRGRATQRQAEPCERWASVRSPNPSGTRSEVDVDDDACSPTRERQVRLQLGAHQAGSNHTGDSRNRGKGGQPPWPITTPERQGLQMRTFGEKHVASPGQADT
jgi:hypothetical protein